jgi:hypothetical protein
VLRLIAEGPGGSFKAPCKVIVEVHRLSGQRLADYWVQALDPFGHPLREGTLRSYPRWTEPLTGFAARCVAGLPTLPGRWNAGAASGALVVAIERGIRTLREVRARFDAERGELTMGATRVTLPVAPTALCLWKAMLVQDGFDALELPPLPAPLRLPLYATTGDAGAMYCRTSDLPGEARAAYGSWRRCLPHHRAPAASVDVPDAADPAEVARFLSGAG